jgi:anti-sigma regulatory factor (Ser/Thr protein kinase)
MPSASTTLRLQPTRHAPSLARQAVRDCGGELSAETLHAALTVMSELVTNAVLHGEGLVTVAIECRSDSMAIAVSDDSPDGLTMLNSGSDADGGRGLVVVEHLANAWGVRPAIDGHGKAVWARIGAIQPRRIHPSE